MAGKRRALEKVCEDHCVDYAWNTWGVEGVKMKLPDRAGEPDRMYLFPGGHSVFVEYKREGEEPRPLQQHRIDELRSWGYDVETCDNKEDGRSQIDRYAKLYGATRVETQKLPAPSRKVHAGKRMRGYMGRPRGR